jgi:hypothetical protein
MNPTTTRPAVELPVGVFDPLTWNSATATTAPLRQALRRVDLNGAAEPAPRRLEIRSLFDVPRPEPGDYSELLKTRFLCRGGGALLVGPTGVGKSSLTMQAALSWAAGLPLFGIEPNGPLRVLLVQGENDDGDLAEARDGVAWAIEGGTAFGDEGEAERVAALLRDNVGVISENALAGDALFDSLGLAMADFRPDLLFIDPAFSFVAGDASNAADVGRFLRQGLNPLLTAHNCGAIIVHHTAKPPGQKGAVDRTTTAYAGFGSAEWSNWARAVLTLEGLGGGRYRLHAAKRGGRIGWRDADGAISFFKGLAHSVNDAGFAWEEAADSDNPEGDGRPGLGELVALVPQSAPIVKETLIFEAQAAGIGICRAKEMIRAAVGEGELFEWRVKVPGRTRAVVKLARFAQPEGGE